MKISVFTPSNNSEWLPNIYECLKEQTYKNWEWVIVYNNGGVPIGFDDPRVTEIFLEYPTNEWVGPMKNLACSKCKGEILLELDHDDLLTPNALQEVAYAFQDSEVGFAYSNTVHSFKDPTDGVDFKKVKRFDAKFGWLYREVEYKGHKLDEHISFRPNPDSISKIWFAPNHLRAFRASVYYQVGGHDKGMRILDDLDLMCRMYQVTKFRHINKGLYIYRVHGGNTWLKHCQEIQDNVFRIHDKYIDPMARRWADLNGLRKIELGGGMNPGSGYETIDLKNANIIHDLNVRWPFKDDSVGVIRAIDILEHLKNPLFTMMEIYRVLAPGGYALIQVPSTDGRGAFQDPTHVSFWNENSFHYYTKKDKAQWIGTPVRFQAARLYTGEKNAEQVCWTIAHLVSLKDGYKPAGLLEV
jgi:glycosyltransferase involved in cell wall biosynthesis